MKKPTLKEAEAYVKEKKLDIDPEYWWWKNEERGWVVVVGGKPAPMKSWKGNLQIWSRNQVRYQGTPAKQSGQSFRDKLNNKGY